MADTEESWTEVRSAAIILFISYLQILIILLFFNVLIIFIISRFLFEYIIHK